MAMDFIKKIAWNLQDQRVLFYNILLHSEMYCEIKACWVIFLQMTVNEQQNDANITLIYCSCFTENSHNKVVFNCHCEKFSCFLL